MKSIRAYLVAAAVIIASPVTITHAVEPPLGDPPLVNEVPNNCGISISADQNWLSVNDNDDNHDEIWDFETESKTSGAEPVVGEKDTLKITVTGTADKSEATVTVSIDTGSDKIDGFWEGTLTISGQSLTIAQLEELAQKELEGQKKDSSKKTTFTFTVPIGRSATQTLYIEGIKHSDSLKDVKINARIEAPAGITPDPDNRPFRASSLAATPLEITVYQVDLDVDSNNNEGFVFTWGSDKEDWIENSATVARVVYPEDVIGTPRPGKIVLSNNRTDSASLDQLVNGGGEGLTAVSAGLQFVPVLLELKEPFDPATAMVTFTYVASEPGISDHGISETGTEAPYVYSINTGGMRLWMKDATGRTSVASVLAATPGDFIPASTETEIAKIDWSKIATDISTPRKAKLYLEYVDKSTPEAAGLKPITVTVTGNGATTDDQVNVTLLPVEFITPAGDPVGSPVDAGNASSSAAVVPDGANEFTFGSAASGVLTMKLKARVEGIGSFPVAEQAKFKFELDSIGNSVFAWDGLNPDGKATISGDFITATATYTGLPQNNSDLGLKKARVKYDGGKIAEDDFEVFFPRDETNHPLGQAGSANWFYYWKDGGVCGIPADAIYDNDPVHSEWYGYTLPDKDSIMRLCPAAPKGPPDGSNPVITLTSNIVKPGSSPPATYGALTLGSAAKGIGCVAATVSHELYHITIYADLAGKADADPHASGGGIGDGVADSSEGNLAGIESSSLHCDTYSISSLGGIYAIYTDFGDEEIRGMKQETNITFPVFPTKDWANPGCQSVNQNGPQP
jgi:hypothetical protein